MTYASAPTATPMTRLTIQNSVEAPCWITPLPTGGTACPERATDTTPSLGASITVLFGPEAGAPPGGICGDPPGYPGGIWPGGIIWPPMIGGAIPATMVFCPGDAGLYPPGPGGPPGAIDGPGGPLGGMP